MITRELGIDLGQKLGHVMSFIPSHCIFNKKIPGLGATFLELICKRCSLLIEPNKPVIKEKVKQFKAKNIDILGVYSGITDERIIKYITSSNPYKKIITTPESYVLRVKPLMQRYEIDMINDYFMLYDESERTIQDIDYRETITAPLEDFFAFKNKAMVTATPINPSDPRFRKNSFYQLLIKPLYDYRKNFHLHTTNNILLSLRDHLKNNPSKHYCLFLNSTDAIHAIIKYLKLEETSKVFCSEKSVKKLRKLGYKTVFNDLQQLCQFNFFTSSFFSAVDIELDYKPDIIILTDIYFAEQSIIDPSTEAVQIVGRFRQGFNSLTHISNVNPTIHFQTRREILSYLKGCHEGYSTIRTLYDTAIDPGAKSTFKQALELVSFAKFITDNRPDHFKIDNKLDEDMVKSYYRSAEDLKTAYSAVDHFTVHHTASNFPLSDQHRLMRSRSKDNNDLFKSIIDQFEILDYKANQFTIDNTTELRNELITEYPHFYSYYTKLGVTVIREKEYKISLAKRALKKKVTVAENHSNPAIMEFLSIYINKQNIPIPSPELNSQAKRLREKYKLTQSNSQFIKSIFSVSTREQKTINGKREWTNKLSNPKFKLPN